MNKITNILVSVVSLAFLIIVAICVFWLTFPYEPIEINKIELNKTQFKKGEFLLYKICYCKNNDIEGHVFRSFENGLVFKMPEIISYIDKGCGALSIAVEIPNEIHAGTYKFNVIIEYRVNPIRNIYVEFTTDEFEIIE